MELGWGLGPGLGSGSISLLYLPRSRLDDMLYDTRKKKNTIKIRNKLFFVLIFQGIFSRRFNIVHLSLQLLLKFHLHVCQTKERPGESQN